jgi:hypothetical protein
LVTTWRVGLRRCFRGVALDTDSERFVEAAPGATDASERLFDGARVRFALEGAAPDVVIGATDAAFLDKLLARVDEQARYEFPPILRDWNRFDARAPAWATRLESGGGADVPSPALGYFLTESERLVELRLSTRVAGRAEAVTRARASIYRDLES